MKTIRSILFNPILFMTVLGVAGGIAFPNGLPVILSGVLRVSNKTWDHVLLLYIQKKIAHQYFVLLSCQLF